ncbi:hypothetical protein ABZ249_25520 [Nocardiopsis sp. NPDC006139]|uniref:hypothetical protein n=1 Tax=Nocardiopsis sp. NPDC006139 TaxID=3154578 RepID=UPI0033A81930
MTLSEIQDLAEVTLPVLTLVALAGVAFITWYITGAVTRHLRRVVRRQDRTIRALEGQLSDAEAQLSEAEAVIARITGGTDEIIAAARGAHRRTQEGAHGV